MILLYSGTSVRGIGRDQKAHRRRCIPCRFHSFHDICQHSAPQEDHVLPARRILDSQSKFLSVAQPGQSSRSKPRAAAEGMAHVESLGITIQHFAEVQLLDLLLQSTRQSREHARSTREDDMLVKLGSHIDRSSLYRIKEQFCRCVDRLLSDTRCTCEREAGIRENSPAIPGCSTSIK